MTIETIVEYLNAVPIRATYGAVGDVLGVRPQVVPRLLGRRRPETSWIVNASTGEPTDHTREQIDPRLARTPIIRSGDELRRDLETANTATTPPRPATRPQRDVSPTPEEVTADETSEKQDTAMKSDTKWIIGSMGAAILLVAALLSGQIASVSASLNARIDDVNDRIDNLRADVTARIASVDTRIEGVRNELGERIATLAGEISSIAAREGAVESEAGATDPELLPSPATNESGSDPTAPATKDPAAQAEPPAQPAEPEGTAEAQPEPAPEPAEPVVSPDQRRD